MDTKELVEKVEASALRDRVAKLERTLKALYAGLMVETASDGRVRWVGYYSDALRPSIGCIDGALADVPDRQ